MLNINPDAMSAKREELIDATVEGLYFLKESLRDNSETESSWAECRNPACLASLILGIKEMGLLQCLERPFMGRSVKTVVESMEAIETPAWHVPHGTSYPMRHACNFRNDLSVIIKTLRNHATRGFSDIFSTHPLLNV